MTRHEKTWDAASYATHGSFVPALGQIVLDWLAPRPGERILDIGCGDGTLSERLVAAGADVLGLDADRSMLAAARERGLAVREMDAQALALDEHFDAIFSNAALHWMGDQQAVIDRAFEHLRPGGRFVVEMGGHGNIAAINTALRAVLARRGLSRPVMAGKVFPTVAEQSARLKGAGFRIERIELAPRPTLLPTGLKGWLETFATLALDGLDPERRQGVLQEVEDLLAPALCDEAGQWTADYVRLRFEAWRPA